MKDPVNPTALDIEAWARDPEAMYPMQDWDLMVASDDNGELLVGLAADPSVAQHDAVMNFLYVYAGQVVREGASAERVEGLKKAIDDAASLPSDELGLWASRAKALLAGLEPSPHAGAAEADYAFWFLHGWRGAQP